MSNTGNAHAKHQFIEEHKAGIIADSIVMFPDKFLEKWGISNSGWHKISKRWASDIEAARKVNPAAAVEEKIRVPTVDDKRRKGYKDENWPVTTQEKYAPLYLQLKAYSDGYRQAILDVFGQKKTDVKGVK